MPPKRFSKPKKTPKKMNETEFMKRALPAMRDTTVLPVHITISDAWMLVTGLQLATKHPEMMDYLRNRLVDIARQFQASIVELHPATQEAIEMGWEE